MYIKIELLSDLCSHSGDVYNTTVDTEVVYDAYGLPFIPAKRLKGCIRESALELLELGRIDEKDYFNIFGKEGNQETAFTISNAHLKDYDTLVEVLKTCPCSEIKNQQNVLEQFTYVRQQTSIELSSGVAKDKSLRTIRVVKKGLCFYAKINWNKDITNKEILYTAISLVKHIGMARTRGLGLVNMTIINDDEKPKEVINSKVKDYLLKHDDENYKIKYTIRLKSPLICKSAQGNQAITEDYIAGGKVLGLIAGSMSKEEYAQLTNNGEIIVSNAYITNKGKRFIPGDISLQKKKDQKYEDDKMLVYNMLFKDAKDLTGEQMTPANVDYINDDNVTMSVDTEISYHHQRPKDKSIGHATGFDDSTFYQLAAISEGQSFSGYIYANNQQTNKILSSISEKNNICLGYGKQNGFGEVDFSIDDIETITKKENKQNKAQVTLVSDLILYNDVGMPSIDINVLENYLRNITNCEDLNIVKPFINTVTIGGFNVTWGTRKPIISAFGKGSTFKIESSKEFDIDALNDSFIGERVIEGYGEIIVKEYPENGEVILVKESNNDDSKIYWKNNLLQELLHKELKKNIQRRIIKIVDDDYIKKLLKNVETSNVAVSKIRLLLKTTKTYNEMVEQVNAFENKATKDKCIELLKLIKPNSLLEDCINDIRHKYDASFKCKWTHEEVYKFIYRDYISYLKYLVKYAKNREVGK